MPGNVILLSAQVSAAARAVHATVMDPEGRALDPEGDARLRGGFTSQLRRILGESRCAQVSFIIFCSSFFSFFFILLLLLLLGLVLSLLLILVLFTAIVYQCYYSFRLLQGVRSTTFMQLSCCGLTFCFSFLPPHPTQVQVLPGGKLRVSMRVHCAWKSKGPPLVKNANCEGPYRCFLSRRDCGSNASSRPCWSQSSRPCPCGGPGGGRKECHCSCLLEPLHLQANCPGNLVRCLEESGRSRCICLPSEGKYVCTLSNVIWLCGLSCLQDHRATLAYTPSHVQVRDVVDLGCATGLSSLELLHAFPNARVEGIDLSPHFLAVGRLLLCQRQASTLLH